MPDTSIPVSSLRAALLLLPLSPFRRPIHEVKGVLQLDLETVPVFFFNFFFLSFGGELLRAYRRDLLFPFAGVFSRACSLAAGHGFFAAPLTVRWLL